MELHIAWRSDWALSGYIRCHVRQVSLYYGELNFFLFQIFKLVWGHQCRVCVCFFSSDQNCIILSTRASLIFSWSSTSGLLLVRFGHLWLKVYIGFFCMIVFQILNYFDGISFVFVCAFSGHIRIAPFWEPLALPL